MKSTRRVGRVHQASEILHPHKVPRPNPQKAALTRAPVFKGPQKIQVFIADAHSMFGEGLRLVLEAQPDVTVIGETVESGDLGELVAKLKPDVVLLDLELVGFDVLREMRSSEFAISVIV